MRMREISKQRQFSHRFEVHHDSLEKFPEIIKTQTQLKGLWGPNKL